MQIPQKQLSNDLRVILDSAYHEAAQRHGNYVDVEHLMLGLLRRDSGTAHELLMQRAIDTQALYDQVALSVGMERPTPARVKDVSRWAKATIERAAEEATALGNTQLNSGHLLLGLMGETDGAVHDALAGIALTPDEVRAYLRNHSEQVSPARAEKPQPGSDDEPEIVLVPFRPARKTRQPGSQTASRVNTVLWIGTALVAIALYLFYALPGNQFFTFTFVLVGWIFSVSLHEFAHALVAYLGGDYTVKDKGYLTFNPLKYTHPLLSIGLPLLFLALGGIGLPGGAVYIERHRLRSKWWGAAVSAAGPAANLLLALVLSLPFITGLVDTGGVLRDVVQVGKPSNIWENGTLWTAVAFLIMLQVTSVFFNLLPIPPLDGFGILEPYLDERTRFQMRQIGMLGLLLIFFMMETPLGDEFWRIVYQVTDALSIPGWMISTGWEAFTFWRK
jgi:Zn-dependent protease